MRTTIVSGDRELSFVRNVLMNPSRGGDVEFHHAHPQHGVIHYRMSFNDESIAQSLRFFPEAVHGNSK